jgi:hypothetical protein
MANQQQNLMMRVLYDKDPGNCKEELDQQSADKLWYDGLNAPRLEGLEPLLESKADSYHGSAEAVYHINGATMVLSKSYYFIDPNFENHKALTFATRVRVFSENTDSINEAVRVLNERGFKEYPKSG